MEKIKSVAYFRIHPVYGILIVIVVTLVSMLLFMYSAPYAYGIPFGGQVSKYQPVCVLDSACGPQGCTTCTISCPQCGSYPYICAGLSEIIVDGQAYCPQQGFPYLGTGKPRSGGWILGFGEPSIVAGLTVPTGTSR